MWCLCISGVTTASATTIWETHYCVGKWDMGALSLDILFYYLVSFFFCPCLATLLLLAWCCTCWRVLFYRSLWFWYAVLCNKLGWNHHCHLQKTDETLPNPSWADLVCTTLLSALSPLPAVIRAVSNGASLFFCCVSLFPIVLERPHSSF